MASSHFARRYFGNRCFFLFLHLLRCFSSVGSLPIAYVFSNGYLISLLSEFPHSEIYDYCGCLLLIIAFRSLPRPSSALITKAFTLCSLFLNLLFVIYCGVLLCWTSYHSSVTYLSMRLRHSFVRLELLAIYPKYLISILDFINITCFSSNIFNLCDILASLPLFVYIWCKLYNPLTSL